MATKFYAVRKGKEPGIYTTWADCQKRVNGFSGAEYKSFLTLDEAKKFLNAGVEPEEDIEYVPIYVDGSYHIDTKEFSYGMVVLNKGQVLRYNQKYTDPELATMRNVAGEIKGAEAAMRYALEHQIEAIAIYHDYEGIAKWCQGLWKTNKEGTKAYKAYYDQVSQKVKIRFVKVAGHTGDTYNEMADVLAKEALGIQS